MANPFSTNSLSEMSVEALKKRETFLKAVMYVAVGFILISIGYSTIHIMSQKDFSLDELIRRNTGALAGFGSVVLATTALKKIRAELTLRGE